MTITSLSSFFTWRCAQEPDALAYAFVRDTLELSESITYAQLQSQVTQLGAQIVARSQPGDRVLLVYPPGLDFARAFWACMLTGRTAVPVPAPDPVRFKNSAPHLQAVIDDAQAALVLTTAELLQPAQEFLAHPAGRAAVWHAIDRLNDPDVRLDARVDVPQTPQVAALADELPGPQTVAYLQYTSGSTAAPRGVMLSHANVLAQCRDAAAVTGVAQGASRMLCWLPHHHDYGLVFGVLGPLHAGVPGYLMSPVTFLRRPLRWLEAVERFAITHTGGPNFAYAACVKALAAQPAWRANLGTLQSASCGAEPIQSKTAVDFLAGFAPHGLSATAFAPAYGMAEAVLTVTATAPGTPLRVLALDADALTQARVQHADATTQRTRQVVGCGRPMAKTHLQIVHPQTRRPCAADRIGEIWVQGSSVGQGYWHQPNVSADVFGARLASSDGPASDGPYLRTGDLGFVHDGELYVTGRIKDLIIVRGRNHAPQDIEWTVQRSDASLRPGYGAAFSVDALDGESLVVVQELERRGHEADLAPLIHAIRKAVATEHELPVHAVVLVRSGSVPRTSSGKVRRQRCRQDYLDGVLQVIQMEVAQTLDALDQAPWAHADVSAPLRGMQRSPERLTAIEQTLLQGVARFARRAPHDTLLDASVIECGLDSLSSFRLLQMLEGALGCALPPASVMGEPNLRAAARRLDGLLDLAQAQAPAALAAALPTLERQGLLPLSAAQQRMWFWQEMAPGTALYNVPVALELHGPLDANVLQHCLDALVQRHEGLRTRWVAEAGLQHQRIEPMHDWRMRHVVLPHSATTPKLEQYEALAAKEALTPFDLTREPAVRATLVTLDPQDHRLLWTLHHSVCDGWSMGVLMDELCLLYEARSHGLPAKLPKLALQALDHAAWEAGVLASGMRERELAYWKQQLAGVPGTLALPTDHRRPARQAFRGATVALSLSATQLAGLQALARRTDTTLFMALLAVWQTLLHRWSGQASVVTGTVIANRERREFDGVVGYFANTLALRSDFDDGLTVGALMAQVKSTALDAYEHQHVPFDEVVDALKLPRDASRMPLIQTFVVLQPPAELQRRMGNVQTQRSPLPSPVARFDLSLELQPVGPQLQGWLEYDRDLFERSTVERLAGHLLTLVESIPADTERRVAELPLLTEAERQQLLLDWNRTERPYALDVSVHTLIERQVRRTPLALAASLGFHPLGEHHLSYTELNLRANQLAHQLRRLGVGPDVLVGVCMERSVELVVGLLAVLKAGGAFVPLDPELPRERLAYMLDDTAAAVVLTQSHLRGCVPGRQDGAPRHLLCLDGLAAEPQPGDDADPVPLTGPEHLAYVIYTSGSTGLPKGVMVPHRALSNHALWLRDHLGTGHGDHILQLTTISFDVAVADFFMPLLSGAGIVLAEPGEHRDTGYLVRTLRDKRITTILTVPSLLRALLDEPGLEGCAYLRHVICGGEALGLELAREFDHRLPQATLHNFYGPTETTINSTECTARGDFGASLTVPIGRPIANTQCYVLDAQCQPVPVGVIGELYIGGAGLAQGYLNQPALTAERFVPHPFAPGERLYRSGDHVRWLANGRLEYVGRADFQVKIRGIRIELGEVEAALNAQPGVQHGVVLAREDEPGRKRLVAYVVGHPGGAPDPAELKRGMKQHLADALIPSAFVLLPQLPILPNGKLDRQALPAPQAPTSRAEMVAPRTPVEQAAWDIWREVLQVPPFDVHDNFFELGGHSLLATQVVARMREVLGVELPLRALFDSPTVAGLAAAIKLRAHDAPDAAPAAWPPITRVARVGQLLPTSYSQRRMWLVQQFNPATTAYNIPLAVRFRGPLDHAVLVESLQHLAARHESFRTTLVAVAGEPMQRIGPVERVAVEILDLRLWPEAEREAEAARVLKDRCTQPYDLAQGPLHRPTLLQLGEQDHVLLWSIHHAIGDGWSAGILLREIAHIYPALARGQAPSLPPMAIDFADYAHWQRRVLGAVLANQLVFWKQALAGLEPLQLPFDRPRRGESSGRGASVSAAFQPQTLTALNTLAVQHGATPYMALLACFQLLLARHCDTTDVAVGTPIANRTHMAAEHLVGTLVNTVVMRTDLAGDPSFVGLLKRVRETALRAYAHQDLPFEALVEALARPRSDGSAPLVQVLFNVLNTPQGAARIEGLTYEPFDFDIGSSQFDLSLSIDLQLFGRAHLSFSTEVFERASGERLLKNFMALVDQVLADPQRPLSAFALTGAEERRTLADWNHTPLALPVGAALVHAQIALQAQRMPAQPALRCGDEQLSHAELQMRALRLARVLRSRGVARGCLVGLCLPRSVDMVVAQLAILHSGAAYVPLDPAYPSDRLVYMAQDAALALVVSNAELGAALDWPADRSLLLDRDAALIAAQLAHPLPPDAALDARPDDPAYVIYTSGSTGRPKGVVLPHAAVVNFLASMAHEPGLQPGDVLVAVTTLSFDIAVLELLLPLFVGATVVLVRRDETTDGRALCTLLESNHATVMQATPSTWRMLIDAGWQGRDGFKALIGGEGLPPDLAQQLLARTGPHGALWNLYGPTETTVWSTCWKVVAPEQGVRIGRPIGNTQIHVLNAHGQPCPIGVAGELYIGGDGVALGYLNRPELTAERFVPDPFSAQPSARLYRTGDRGRWCHDGLLEHQGRLDFQVKVRGHRIELGEIEAALGSHAQVARAVVIVREDRPGDLRLVAYVVPKGKRPKDERLNGEAPDVEMPNVEMLHGEVPTAAALREHLRGSLPDYMLPQHVVLIAAVPLLPNGKMDRHALPAPDRSADAAGERPLAAHELPQSATEQAVAAVWQALLGPGPIARSDNFFDLGGHSLLAMRAVGDMERQAGVRIELRQLVHETLAQIAATPAQVAAPDAAPAAESPAQAAAQADAPPAAPGSLKRMIRSVRDLIGS